MVFRITDTNAGVIDRFSALPANNSTFFFGRYVESPMKKPLVEDAARRVPPEVIDVLERPHRGRMSESAGRLAPGLL